MAKKSSKYDPLEAAKLESGAAESPKKSEAPKAESPKAESPADPPRTNRKYRVLEKRRMNVGTGISTISEGTVISEQGYGGAGGVANLIKGGLKLEEIQD